MATTCWSIRISLDDHPGRLAEVAAVLGSLGVDVLDLDVHGLDSDDGGGRVADELRVGLPFWIEPAIVEAALRSVAVDVVGARRLDPHELVDPQARLLDVVGWLVIGDADDADVAAGLAAVLGARHVWLGPVPGLRPHGPAGEALESRSPVIGRAPLLRAGAAGHGEVAALALPWGRDPVRVALVQRLRPDFTATEVARARGLLDLAAEVRQRRTVSSGSAPGRPR